MILQEDDGGEMENLLELFSSMEPGLKAQFLAALAASLLIGSLIGVFLNGAFGLWQKYPSLLPRKKPVHKHQSPEEKERKIEFYQSIILAYEEYYSQIYDERNGIPKLIRQGYRKHIHGRFKRNSRLADKSIKGLHSQIMFHINRKTGTDEELALMAVDLFNETYDQLEND